MGPARGPHRASHPARRRPACPTGRVTGLIGSNGAGKTTLLRAALGVLPARAGAVAVDCEPLRPAARPLVTSLGGTSAPGTSPVSVRGAVLSALTRRNALLRRPTGAERRAADEALACVSLAGLAVRPVGQLSDGQRQRVLLARALVPHPALLLLDEPFVGIDARIQQLVVDVLRGLRDRGTGILVPTHDLAAAAALSDRCACSRPRARRGPAEDPPRPTVWLETFGRP